MKNFMSKVQGLFGEESGDGDPNVSILSPFKKKIRNNSKTHDAVSGHKINENETMSIYNAAQTLADSLQEILNDTSNLSGNSMAGFYKLFRMLDEDNSHDEHLETTHCAGVGCLQILINNMNNKVFIETCNRAGLGVALLNALRLIRMYELKRSKSGGNLDKSTFSASLRVCQVFEYLCSKQQTVEQIRQSLVKVLTFPLTSLPFLGVHIQEHSSGMVFAMCKSGFTSQQVWYLHDVQVMTHMVRQLHELTILSSNVHEDGEFKSANGVLDDQPYEANDKLLRGSDAEKCGMWIVAVRCVVEVVLSTGKISNVLMGDFETSGGIQIFLHILQCSGRDRFSRILNTISRLLFDPLRCVVSNCEDNSKSPSPTIALLLLEHMMLSLSTNQSVSATDSIENMISLAQHIDRTNCGSFGRDYIVQAYAYALLTIYSNDPANCIYLESNYHFLPLLLLALPIMENSDAISAVLTSLNYVCQCVDVVADIPLMALCASTAVVMKNATSAPSDTLVHTKFQLTQCFSSMDTIIRSNTKFAKLLINSGLFKYVVCDAFNRLCSQISLDGFSEQSCFDVYDMTITFVTSIISRSSLFGDEVRINKFDKLVRSLLENTSLPSLYTLSLLKVPQALSMVDETYLRDSFDYLFDLLSVVQYDCHKLRAIVNCLLEIIFLNKLRNSGYIFTSKDGIDKMLNLLQINCNFLKCDFSEAAFKLLDSILTVLTSVFSLLSDADLKDVSLIQFYYKQVGINLYKSGVFETKYATAAIDLVLRMIEGTESGKIIRVGGAEHFIALNPKAVYVVLQLIPKLDPLHIELIMTSLCDCAEFNELNVIRFNTINLSSELLKLFPDVFFSILPQRNPNVVHNRVLQLIILLSKSLTLHSFRSLFLNMVQLVNCSQFECSTKEQNLSTQLQMPWMPFCQIFSNSSDDNWCGVAFLIDLAENGNSLNDGVSKVVLTNSKVRDISIPRIEIEFSSSSHACRFPKDRFSYSCWVQIPENESGIVSLFSLRNQSLGCFFEVQLDINNSFFRVVSQRCGLVSTSRFKFGLSIILTDWNLVVVSFQRTKRFSSAKSSLTISLNGVHSIAINNDIDIDLPLNHQPVTLCIGGQDNNLKNLSQCVASGDRLLIDNMLFVNRWSLGPFRLFDEVINNDQVVTIFLRGPKYTGSFQAGTLFFEHFPAAVTDLLCRCRNFGKSIDFFFEMLGLKGIEIVVEPKIELLSDVPLTYRYAQLPSPIASFSGSATEASCVDPPKNCEIDSNLKNISYLSNTMSDTGFPLATLVGSNLSSCYVSNCLSVGDCISAMGGPECILPLVHKTSNSVQLCLALHLLRLVVRTNTVNLHFMMKQGYKMLSFILSLKPNSFITESVVDHIFEMGIDRSHSQGGKNAHCLLVDTSAFYNLLLNHQTLGYGRYIVSTVIVKHILSLVNDERYCSLNCKRLSCIGVAKWLIMTTLEGMNRLQSSDILESYVENWTFMKATAAEMSEYREDPDPYFQNVMLCLQRIISIEVRRKDVDLIVSGILYSFVVRSEPNPTTTGGGVETIRYPFCNYDNFHSSEHSISSLSPLSPLSFLRVHLLRLFFHIFDDRAEELRLNGLRKVGLGNSSGDVDGFQVFRQSLTPVTFLGILEKSSDSASKAQCLRLLGLILQKDFIFLREFCNLKGFQSILSMMSAKVQDIPIVLPLLAMLFRVPMQLLMHPFQIKSSVKFAQILDLDECFGPDLIEPNLTDITVPLMMIIFDIVANSFQAQEMGENITYYSLMSDLIFGMLLHGLERILTFKQLFQNKSIVNAAVRTLLMCSNAYTLYGTSVFCEMLDLNTVLKDDYIHLSGNLSSNTAGICNSEGRDFKDKPCSDPVELILFGKEAFKLGEMISMSIAQAISELDNYCILFNYFSSYPNNVSRDYEHGYQHLIWSKFLNAVKDVTEISFDVAVILNISNITTSLIPLCRANILHESILIELLKLNLELLSKAIEAPCSSSIANSHDRTQKVIKELGNTSRYFAIACIHKRTLLCATSRDMSGRLHIFNTVRVNLDNLLHILLDDCSDLNVSAVNSAVAVSNRFVNRNYLDSEIGTHRKNSSSLTITKHERNRFSSYFCVYLVHACYLLVLEDDASVRMEAIRIISYLCRFRKELIEQLLGNGSSNSNVNASSRIWRSIAVVEHEDSLFLNNRGKLDIDVFKDGFAKLIPNAAGKFDLYFRGGSSDEHDSELSRFADFSYWVSDNNSKCDKVFSVIETALQSMLFNPVESDELLKQLQQFNWPLEVEFGVHSASAANRVMQKMGRAENCQKWGEQIIVALKRWSVMGLMSLSCGGIHWRRVWYTAQCSAVWGLQDIECWSLNVSEGPERVRRKIEKDFSSGVHLFVKDSERQNSNLQPTSNSESLSLPNEVKIVSEDNAAEMELFLREIASKGLIKKLKCSEKLTDEIEMFDFEDTGDISDSSLPFPGKNKEEDNEDDSCIATPENMFSGDTLDAGSADANQFLFTTPSMSENIIKSNKSTILQELIKGVIGSSEWLCGVPYNVEKIYGLETQRSLLLITRNNIHILQGFAMTRDNVHNTIKSKAVDCLLEWIPSFTNDPTSLQKNRLLVLEKLAASEYFGSIHHILQEKERWLNDIWEDLLLSDSTYTKIPLFEVYSFFKRRHELKYTAMEITDVNGISILFSCENVLDNDEILLNLLEADLPSSIFNRVIGIKNLQMLRGANFLYARLMSLFVGSLTACWQHGELSNFEYLMHINYAAGRSFQDLTQYPIFPWIIADYKSDELDLEDPGVYRDLKKPMGAIGFKRALQYRERYQTMHDFYKEGIDGCAPPFFYGTHYSCAGYVLHYLIRMQPFANMSIALQGGAFDKPDRLFTSIENSWLSASSENLQDVRELIPEFFYLPEFLVNKNRFNFGTTQKEDIVNDVALPAWAHNDPNEFVRIHRQALESKYVSENLHNWIDLIFGFKQQGKASLDAVNVFIHLTYEGEVDVDKIDDPIMRSATISQINNFGQCPSKLFNKPHPKKVTPEVVKKIGDIIIVDPIALAWHGNLSPPLSVVGASQYNVLQKVSHFQVLFAGNQKGLAVGDIHLLSRDRVIGASVGSYFVPPACKSVLRFKDISVCGGVKFEALSGVAGVGTRVGVDVDNESTTHEHLHASNISCAAFCKSGNSFATGSEDSSLRVWNISKSQNRRSLTLVSTFYGHMGIITCLDISSEFSLLVSGDDDNKLCIWDFRTKSMVKEFHELTGQLLSLSIGQINGNVAVLTKSHLRLYTVNGVLISSVGMFHEMSLVEMTIPRIVLATPCADWQDGVVAVTGHEDGQVFMWKLRKSVENVRELYVSFTPTKTHCAHISMLKLIRVTNFAKQKDMVSKAFEKSRHMDLFVGDVDGFVSRWTPYKLDQLQNVDLYDVYGFTT